MGRWGQVGEILSEAGRRDMQETRQSGISAGRTPPCSCPLSLPALLLDHLGVGLGLGLSPQGGLPATSISCSPQQMIPTCNFFFRYRS